MILFCRCLFSGVAFCLSLLCAFFVCGSGSSSGVSSSSGSNSSSSCSSSIRVVEMNLQYW